MACHEIAALRLGMMRILGRDDVAERQHELAELGSAAEQPGPVRALCEATDLAQLRSSFASALADLEGRVAAEPPSSPKLPYLRSLIVFTKKVELDLANQIDALGRFHGDLERMHDLIHEIYPAE